MCAWQMHAKSLHYLSVGADESHHLAGLHGWFEADANAIDFVKSRLYEKGDKQWSYSLVTTEFNFQKRNLKKTKAKLKTALNAPLRCCKYQGARSTEDCQQPCQSVRRRKMRSVFEERREPRVSENYENVFPHGACGCITVCNGFFFFSPKSMMKTHRRKLEDNVVAVVGVHCGRLSENDRSIGSVEEG